MSCRRRCDDDDDVDVRVRVGSGQHASGYGTKCRRRRVAACVSYGTAGGGRASMRVWVRVTMSGRCQYDDDVSVRRDGHADGKVSRLTMTVCRWLRYVDGDDVGRLRRRRTVSAGRVAGGCVGATNMRRRQHSMQLRRATGGRGAARVMSATASSAARQRMQCRRMYAAGGGRAGRWVSYDVRRSGVGRRLRCTANVWRRVSMSCRVQGRWELCVRMSGVSYGAGVGGVCTMSVSGARTAAVLGGRPSMVSMSMTATMRMYGCEAGQANTAACTVEVRGGLRCVRWVHDVSMRAATVTARRTMSTTTATGDGVCRRGCTMYGSAATGGLVSSKCMSGRARAAAYGYDDDTSDACLMLRRKCTARRAAARRRRGGGGGGRTAAAAGGGSTAQWYELVMSTVTVSMMSGYGYRMSVWSTMVTVSMGC